MAWVAGQYAAIAYHDPKSLPDDPTHQKSDRARSEQSEADAIAARAVLKAWANRSGKHG